MGKLLSFFKRKEENEEVRIILSIDGGGMRGIVPAHIIRKLAELFESIGDNRPFYSHFDLIAGTSTGALLALGLGMNGKGSILKKDEGEIVAVKGIRKTGLFRKEEFIKGYIPRGIDAKALEGIYLENAERIFPKKLSTSVFMQLLKDKYDEKDLERFLYDCLHDERLEDVNVPVLIISYDTDGSTPYLFRSYVEKKAFSRDAARASSAAPMYFPAFRYIDEEGRKKVLLDGGLIQNNPSYLAYLEGKKLYPDAKRFIVLSLSTAKRTLSFDPSIKPGGLTGWASPIIKVYMTSQENMTDMVMKNLPDVSYIRIWGEPDGKRIRLDDTSDESIRHLEDAAELIFNENRECLEKLVRFIKDRPVPERVRLIMPPDTLQLEHRQESENS